jgi:hypothetical protein
MLLRGNFFLGFELLGFFCCWKELLLLPASAGAIAITGGSEKNVWGITPFFLLLLLLLLFVKRQAATVKSWKNPEH